VNRILAEGKQTRRDNRVSVFHAAVSVADFHKTMAPVVRPASGLMLTRFERFAILSPEDTRRARDFFIPVPFCLNQISRLQAPIAK
jgi:hypothetical protein